MGEFVGSFDLAPGDLSPSSDHDVEILIPAAAKTWTILVAPHHTGGGVPPDPDVEVFYQVGQDFLASNPPGAPQAATLNKANVITRSDAVHKILLRVSTGIAPVPDQGIKIKLSTTRD